MTDEAVIEATGLTKDHGSGRGVFDVDLTIAPGTVHGLIGPNGAGKTTLMRVLLGLSSPTRGEARMFGERVGAADALSRVGALIETPQLFAGLSGARNLRYLALHAGVERTAVTRAVDAVGLREAASRHFGTYSLGMKQRLGIASALLKDPQLLILDEPMNGLDPMGMSDVRELIEQLREDGRTVLLSSHQLTDIETLCDRVTVVKDGRVVADDTVPNLSASRASTEHLVSGGDLQLLRGALLRHVGAEQLRSTTDGVYVNLDINAAAEVLRALVLDGVPVDRFERRASLEGIFTNMMGENAIGSDQFARREEKSA